MWRCVAGCRLITPSAEKADWLNSLLAKLWPKMREAIAASIAASLEPTLEEYCPSFLSKLGVRAWATQ